ncbi:MAG TPA: hypothetical protein VEW69_01185, partial [Alphaproteobacteria bacterium]|nr:hypothetical protein [Alphaproteobacteria bacterium]
SLGRCKTYILRAQTFAGASAGNFMIAQLRGTPADQRFWGKRMRQKGSRVPLLLPSGDGALEHRFQFVHVDDVARLMAYIVRRTVSDRDLTVLNVAGRGEPLSLRACLQEARLKPMHVPGTALLRNVQGIFCRLGISDIAPEAVFYALGSFTVDTTRLRLFLGEDYRKVIQYTCDQALRESFVHSS